MSEKKPGKSEKKSPPPSPAPERVDPFMQFMQGLTDATRRSMKAGMRTKHPLELTPKPQLGEEHDDFASYRDSLSSDTLRQLDELVPAAQDTVPDPDANAACFGMVEAENGEWAKMRLFRDVEALAHRLAEQEGKDIVVWCFYGIPLKLSRGPQRYLMLPDGRNAVKIPMGCVGPVEFVDGGFLDSFEMQEDGFIGPPQLAEGSLPDLPAPPMAAPGDFKKKGKGKTDKTIDDDDEDHPEGSTK